jgi:hypothetical protein
VDEEVVVVNGAPTKRAQLRIARLRGRSKSATATLLNHDDRTHLEVSAITSAPKSKALWRELRDALDFGSAEVKVLRLALEALDRASQARRLLKRGGMTYLDRFGAPHAHPAVKIERDSSNAAARLFAQLALPEDLASSSALPAPLRRVS